VILTAQFHYGGYQFIQRYRFKDDGRLVASIRFGGIFQEKWHQHVVNWRFQLDPDGGGNDVLQRCEGGGCAADQTGWSTRGCECERTSSDDTNWRAYDLGSVTGGEPDRYIEITPGPNDGTSDVCGDDDHDYCALRVSPTGIVNEGVRYGHAQAADCIDGLGEYASTTCQTEGDIAGGGPLAFWYTAHFNDHDPCDPDEQNFCEPHIGEQARGAVLTLKGGW
jgi:hypothetical protein